MKKQFFIYIPVTLLLFVAFCLKASAQNVQVDAKIDQTTIRIGDQTKLHLVVHQPAKTLVTFPKLADTLTGKVQIVGANKPDTTADKNDPKSITIDQSYTITGFDAGTYIIPSFIFGTSAGALTTNELTLNVATVKVDTTKGIYDIKQPLAVSYTFFDWLKDNWYLVALALVAIGFVIWLIRYLKKRPKTEPIIQIVPKTVLPPHQVALGKLKELRDKKLWQHDDVKLYHSELSDIVREYMEKRYGIKTHEKTTDEIFAGLRYLDITQENKNLLSHILKLADLVKFAKEKPLPADNEQSIENAFSFVVSTQQAAAPVIAGGGSKDV